MPACLLLMLTSRCTPPGGGADSQTAAATSESRQIPGVQVAAQTAGHGRYFDAAWADTSLWDDGQAEVNTYDARRVIYGKTRTFELTLISVKEVFNEQYEVKTDDYDRNDLFEVLKINRFCRIPTDSYPYHFMTSMFFRRDQPARLHKYTGSSQEWCGITHKHFLREGSKMAYIWDSYWDGEGRGRDYLKHPPLLADQLSYTLRSLRFEAGLSFQVPLLPTMIHSRATLPDEVQATVAVGAQESVQTPAGTFRCWPVEVRWGEGPYQRYWFEVAGPQRLIRYEMSDGRAGTLKASRRWAYWKRNAP